MSFLKIHVTYQCSSECAHCRFGCRRGVPGPAIDHDLAMSCVRALQDGNDLQMVVLMGGEPGLVPELTHRLARDIGALGIRTRVETNASWATDIPAARRFLTPLAAAGTSVMFSLDAFHEPFIPPARVETAIRVCDALDVAYNLEMAYLDVEQRTHALDRRTDGLLGELEDRLGRSPCCRAYQGNVFYNGRAAAELAPLVADGRGVPQERCEAVPWWLDSSLRTLDLLILDPEGYLSKGCGIAIASVLEQTVETILSTYDAQRHPIFSTLLTDGPLGLAREAEALGYTIKADYVDRCHLCQEARQVLRPEYPDLLVPDEHYVL